MLNTFDVTNKEARSVYYTEVKHDEYLKIRWGCRKHEPSVYYISLECSQMSGALLHSVIHGLGFYYVYTFIKHELLTPSQRARVLSLLYIQMQLISHHVHLFFYLLFNIYYFLFIRMRVLVILASLMKPASVDSQTRNTTAFVQLTLRDKTAKQVKKKQQQQQQQQQQTKPKPKTEKKRIAAGQTLWCMHMLLNLNSATLV